MINFAHKRFLANPLDMAVNSAHGLAFHRGLGNPTASSSSTPYTKYLEADVIEWYSQFAYAKSNFALVANGAEQSELGKWTNEFFGDAHAVSGEAPTTGTEQTKYYGGQERIAHDKANAFVIAFPGSSSFTGKFYKPEIAVLASLLGGQSNIKWSSGFSLLGNAKASPGTSVKTTSAIYSDAGLLYTAITGHAEYVKETAKTTVGLIKGIAAGEISPELFQKAKASAKFRELEYGQDITAGIVYTGSGLVSNNQAYQIDEVAKAIDGVTEEALKSVSSRNLPDLRWKTLTTCFRPPSHYLSRKHQYQPSVTFMCYHLLRTLASRCKYNRSAMLKWCEALLEQGLDVTLPVISPR